MKKEKTIIMQASDETIRRMELIFGGPEKQEVGGSGAVWESIEDVDSTPPPVTEVPEDLVEKTMNRCKPAIDYAVAIRETPKYKSWFISLWEKIWLSNY